MRPSTPNAHRPYVLPSVPRRILSAFLAGLGAAIVYLLVPYEAANELASYGIPFPYALGSLLLAGTVLVVLAVARSASRPTRAYGPVSMLADAALLVYLFRIAQSSTFAISFHGIDVALAVGTFVELLMIAPAIRLLADAVTTAEDAARPGERYPFDFPA